MLLWLISAGVTLNLVNCETIDCIDRSIPLSKNSTKLYAPVGHQVILQCPAYKEFAKLIRSGSFEYAVRWYKLQEEGLKKLGPEGFHKHFPMYRVLPEGRLHIFGLQKELHEATYHCEVTNESCGTVEGQITLEVIHCNDSRGREFCKNGDCVMTQLHTNFSFLSCSCFPRYSGIRCDYERTLLFENWHMTWYPFIFALAVFLAGVPVMHIIAAIKIPLDCCKVPGAPKTTCNICPVWLTMNYTGSLNQWTCVERITMDEGC